MKKGTAKIKPTKAIIIQSMYKADLKKVAAATTKSKAAKVTKKPAKVIETPSKSVTIHTSTNILEKTCVRCNVLKTLEEFGNLSTAKDLKQKHCKACAKIAGKVSREKIAKRLVDAENAVEL